MRVFDDSLPLGKIDFSEYLPRLAADGFNPDLIRDSLKTNLRLRSIVANLNEGDAGSANGEALVEVGIVAAMKSIEDPSAPLSSRERLGTEAVIRLSERPALLVKDDSFGDPPKRWGRLDNPYRRDIESVLPQVGRVEIGSGASTTMMGTGFVVADDLIMTNMHVVEEFADPAPDGSRWKIRANANPVIDFKAEFEVDKRKAFRIVEIVLAHDRTANGRMESLDLAVLRVEKQSFEPAGIPLPKPCMISGNAPSNDDDRDLYLVGYPWTDNEGVVPPDVMKAIFNDIYQAKRLQPGEYGANFDDFLAFSHDCSTLGGNSGSGVIDLQSGKVVGLHFRGLYRRANYALQLWPLKRELSALGLNVG